jgi:flavin-dependent dehydrogenase
VLIFAPAAAPPHSERVLKEAPVDTSQARTVDIAILGGGLAGLLLARQLRRTLPGLSLALFERSRETSFKVGESTVEIASNYLIRRLGLSTYLYENQLPKNGLRFFFDTPDKSTPMVDMSEIGSRNLPVFPSFQIDRARLEADLLRMNLADGAQIRTGARAHDLQLHEPEGPSRTASGMHEFTVTEGDTQLPRARALGRRRQRPRQRHRPPQGPPRPRRRPRHRRGLGPLHRPRRHGRTGTPAWRARVHNTARVLSTNHFCYPGYWIWFIPLGRGVMSVGWVGDSKSSSATRCANPRASSSSSSRTAPPGTSSRTAPSCSTCLAYKQLAYGTKRFFAGEDRWFLTGEAAAFTDPFYSPGSDFIALENDFITDMIARDHAGETRTQIAERSAAYDEFMQFRYQANSLLYRDLYPVLGSYELLKLKWDFDISSYYNLWAAPFWHDQHLDLRQLKSDLRRKDFVLQGLENFSRLFQKLEAGFREQGLWHRANLGRFACALESVDFASELTAPRSRKQIMRTSEALFNNIRGRALDLLADLGEPPSSAERHLPFFEFMLASPLA